MTRTGCTKETSVRISPHWVVSSDTIREFLALEVDLVVLCRELSKLGNMSSRIATDIRSLRVQAEDI